MDEFKEILKLNWARWTLGILAFLFVFLLSFGLGVSVGYQKAIFSSDWGRNYEHNFLPMPPMSATVAGGETAPFDAHGAAGTVIDISNSDISVRDEDNDEQSVVVASDTVIRKVDQTIPLSAIAIGDHIVVIGAPNSEGQVEARFIRIFPASGSGGGSQP
jgi:hypothetical protein